jgi:hypothetical protein
MAWAVAATIGRRDRGRIHQGDVWHKVFAADVPRKREVQALILTKNAEYRGTVVGYTVNVDISNRELELRHVTFRMRSDSNGLPQYLPVPFDRVVIASAAVEEMWLHYRNEIEPHSPWWKRLMARWERRHKVPATGEVAESPKSARSDDHRGNGSPSPQSMLGLELTQCEAGELQTTTPSASEGDHTTDG